MPGPSPAARSGTADRTEAPWGSLPTGPIPVRTVAVAPGGARPMTTTAPSPIAHRPPPVGWGPRRLRYPRLAAAIAVVAGIFVTAPGAGIAIRYLTKTGLTWTS